MWEVRRLVNKVPFREMHEPGGGVGGHCIPKDPWLLAAAVQSDVPLRLIPAAREVNDGMPGEVAARTLERIAETGITLGRNPVIAILGYSYRPETGDTRNSPSERLVAALQDSGASTRVHDPYVIGLDSPIDECLKGAHAVIVMVEHSIYADLEFDVPVVVRARNLTAPISTTGSHR